MPTNTFKVLRPIIWTGSRREVGETVEMTDAEARNIGSEYLAAVGTKPKAEPEAATEAKAEDGEGHGEAPKKPATAAHGKARK